MTLVIRRKTIVSTLFKVYPFKFITLQEEEMNETIPSIAMISTELFRRLGCQLAALPHTDRLFYANDSSEEKVI